jgi:outer membrane translocation and assembly module TamA
VNSLIASIGSSNHKNEFLDDTEDDVNFQDRYILAGYAYDTVTDRYLMATRGRRVALTYQQGIETLDGNQRYRSGLFEASQYVPLARESTLASRFFYGRSVGEDPQVYRLGGVDRIRGVSQGAEAHKKTNVVLGSAEARLRIKYLNARTKFLFPDFFFKAAYLIVFDDVGYGWDNATERRDFGADKVDNSAGVGISWPTFILQSFQLNLTVQWAKRTDNGSEVWFITVGPQF